MSTELALKRDTPERQHAAFCERRFALELFRLVREWKSTGKPVKR